MRKNTNILHGLGFTEKYLNSVARDTGFIKRFRKLNGLDYLTILLLNVSKQIVSYNTMASTFLETMDKSVFKQAIHKAMSKKEFLLYINRIFNEILQIKVGLSNNSLKSKFKRIIIQDSTIIKLPQRLFEYFSGVKNQITQVSNARIQFGFDLKANAFTLFSIDPYFINDLLAGCKLIIKKGDLIIRDRGYCCLAEIRRIIEYKADFIYRYYHGFKYYDANTGQGVNIYELVKNTSRLKIKLRIGSADGPIVTLFAVRVKDAVANKRRYQLKKSTKGVASKELLQLLSWSIFFTSIEEEITFEEIFSLYALRWRIEIIFKAMKSHLNADKIHNVPKHQLTFILLGKMILMIIITQFIYANIYIRIYKKMGNIISLLKLVRYIKDNIILITELLKAVKKKNYISSESMQMVIKYCCYERRKDRKNYEQELRLICLS